MERAWEAMLDECLFVEGEQDLKQISSFEAPWGVFLKVGVGSKHHFL